MARKSFAFLTFFLCIFLISCKPKGSVSGRVTDANGDPLKGIIVTLDDDAIGPPFFFQALTNADGQYHFGDHGTGGRVLTILWKNNPGCPTLTLNDPGKQMQFFYARYETLGTSNAFLAMLIFHYMKGDVRVMNLQIPCTASSSKKP